MNKLKSTGTRLFKIIINNERVKLPESEYSVHHVYLHGFKKAEIHITQERVNGEVDYMNIPEIDIDNDTLTFKQRDEPVVKHDFSENISSFISNNTLIGVFEPLYARISDENNLIVSVNNKYVFNAEEIELIVKGSNSIVNVLIYPFKLLWIYSPKARVEIKNSNSKLVFKVDEIIDNYIKDSNNVEREEFEEKEKLEIKEKI